MRSDGTATGRIEAELAGCTRGHRGSNGGTNRFFGGDVGISTRTTDGGNDAESNRERVTGGVAKLGNVADGCCGRSRDTTASAVPQGAPASMTFPLASHLAQLLETPAAVDEIVFAPVPVKLKVAW